MGDVNVKKELILTAVQICEYPIVNRRLLDIRLHNRWIRYCLKLCLLL